MSLKFKIINGLFLLFITISSVHGAVKRETHYYSLNFLKKAGPPIAKEIVMFNNEAGKNTTLEKGILFTYKSRKARSVKISGNFSHWSPVNLTRGVNGVWFFFLREHRENPTIEYKFLVDGTWIIDPLNKFKKDDNYGSYISIVESAYSVKTRRLSYQMLEDNIIEFRHHNATASIISVVGDFNNWNPEDDVLVKDRANIWRLKKHIPSGTYRYKLIIDGKWTPDIYNENSASDGTGGICSLLKVN